MTLARKKPRPGSCRDDLDKNEEPVGDEGNDDLLEYVPPTDEEASNDDGDGSEGGGGDEGNEDGGEDNGSVDFGSDGPVD